MQNRRARSSVFLLLAALGLAASSAQLLLVREFLAVFAGNELTLGAIFAGWFGGIFLGATAARKDVRRPVLALGASCVLLLAVAAAAMILLRHTREVFSLEPGELPGPGALLAAVTLFAAPVGFLIGFSFPFACRAGAGETAGEMPGRAYVWESAGAVVAGLLVSLVLAGRAPSLVALGLVSLGLLCALGAWLMSVSRRGWGVAFFCLAAGLLAAALSGGLRAADEALSEKRFSLLQSGTERMAFAETPYQYLDLGRSAEQYSLFADGKLAAVFPDPLQAALRANLVLAEHQRPRGLLLLSSASFGMLPACLRHPLERIDLVELDHRVIDLVRGRLDADTAAALEDGRVRVHATDGRRYLRESREAWDVIFSDAPDPTTAALNRFFTREFFDLARRHLAPGGVLAARISSSPGTLGQETLGWVGTVADTLRDVFAQVLLIPGQETFFFASDAAGVLLSDPQALGRRFSASGAEDPIFTPYHFNLLVQPGLIDDLGQQLAARGIKALNTDSRPLTYLWGLLRWIRIGQERGAAGPATQEWFLRPATWWAACLGAATASLLGLWFLSRSAVRARRFAILAVFFVGGAGMALELVLLHAWQSLLGSLYQELGLVAACFMAGIVAGGSQVGRLAKAARISSLLAWVVIGVALFTVALAGLLEIAGALKAWLQPALLSLSLLAGVGTGLVFPLSGRFLVAAGKPQAKAAAALEAGDHLGAAAGAFLTGVVLLPLLGRSQCCLLWGIVLGLAGVALLFASRRSD